MERSYRQVVNRCKELKERYGDAFGPCRGSKAVLEKRIAEFEAKTALIDDKETNKDSIPLPEELITHELLRWLSVKDILSFCQTNSVARQRCEDLMIWQDHFATLSYREVQDAILYWSYSGLMLNTLVNLLPSILHLLDGNTMIHAYLYLVEQDRKALIDPIVKTIQAHYKERFSAPRWEKFCHCLTIDRSVYGLIDTLIGMLKRLSSAASLKGQYTKIRTRLLPIMGDEILNRYLDRIIVQSLSDDELIAIFENYGDGKSLALGRTCNDLSSAIERGLIVSKRIKNPSKLKTIATPYTWSYEYGANGSRDLYLGTIDQAKRWLLDNCIKNDCFLYPIRLYELFDPEELALLIGDDQDTREETLQGGQYWYHDRWNELFQQAGRKTDR